MYGLQPFRARGVYVASSYMSHVGKYNGQHLEKRSFIELAEHVSEIFESRSRQ